MTLRLVLLVTFLCGLLALWWAGTFEDVGDVVRPEAHPVTRLVDGTPDFEPVWRGPALPTDGHAARRVIIIGVDTLRRDHVSAYGYGRNTTPTLVRLATEEGVLFDAAYSASSWTLPSMTSVFTSVPAPRHRVEDRGKRLGQRVPTMATAFATQGWTTAAFVTHIYVSSIFGLQAGFQQFHELSIEQHFAEGYQLRADAVIERAEAWIESHSEEPFFLYLHLFDPHWDYDPPPPHDHQFTDADYAGKASGSWEYLQEYLPADELMAPADLAQVVALYDGEIAYADSQVRRLIDFLRHRGLYEDACVVLLADHGEEFQEHGSVHHIRTLYQEVLQVPLIIKPPGGRGEFRPRVPERVRTLDVAPTVLGFAGLRVPESFDGRSLEPLMRWPGEGRDVLARTVRHHSDKVALLHGRWKLIHTYAGNRVADELFDLDDDPHEQRSVADSHPRVVVSLRRLLAGRLEEMEADPVPGLDESKVELTPEQTEDLRALGYVQ